MFFKTKLVLKNKSINFHKINSFSKKALFWKTSLLILQRSLSKILITISLVLSKFLYAPNVYTQVHPILVHFARGIIIFLSDKSHLLMPINIGMHTILYSILDGNQSHLLSTSIGTWIALYYHYGVCVWKIAYEYSI